VAAKEEKLSGHQRFTGIGSEKWEMENGKPRFPG
jgi:hypothetical protein